MTVLVGCRSVESVPRLDIPDLTAFRPAYEPSGLIDAPQTDVDLLHNSVQWEFWGVEWMEYALSYEDMILQLQTIFE